VSYLSELARALRRARVPGGQRRRILAEVHDHLLEAGDGGPGRLGDPGALAAGFAAESASAGARGLPGARRGGPGHAGALGRDLARRARARAGDWELAFAAGLGAACLLALAAAAAAARSAYRTHAVAEHGGEDIVADLAALGTEALDRVPARLAAPARRVLSSPWLDLRGHPWRFCATLAGAVCAAIVAAGLVHGEPSPAVVVVEALAIVAGFATFGRLFGLRP